MRTIVTNSSYDVNIGKSAILTDLALFLTENYPNAVIYVLVDSNTLTHCFPILAEAIPQLQEVELIEVEPGEESKELEICAHIWQTLSEQQADRSALLINLGGGMITDLGGFVASIYKRGIDFINVPTSLLAQVDASVGNKNGIDFLGFKNQLGTFTAPKGVFVCIDFLRTLEKRQLVSGMAEVFKHGLIADANYFHSVINQLKNIDFEEVVHKSIAIKNQIVNNDPLEKGERKKLNFGHTAGHAIESQALNRKVDLLHGEAIAIGMLIELEISILKGLLKNDEKSEVYALFQSFFPLFSIKESDIEEIISLSKQDKKNRNNGFQFTLLTAIGETVINQEVSEKVYHQAILNYNNQLSL
jgi:3-dehydroquinate synthase